MIGTTRRRRIEVLVDLALARLVAREADRAGVSNWTLIPTFAGKDREHAWHRDELPDAERRMLFLTVLPEDKAAVLIEALTPLLESHGLGLFLSDVEVVRGERF